MRKTCDFCSRPLSVCLCKVLPKQRFKTRTKIVILQHPHESRESLGSVSWVTLCLSNCQVFVGRKIPPEICAILDDCIVDASSSSAEDGNAMTRCKNCGEKRAVLLLFPTPTAIDLRTWFQSFVESSSSANSEPVLNSSSNDDGDSSNAHTSTSALPTEEKGTLSNSLENLHSMSDYQNQETGGCPELMSQRGMRHANCQESHLILLLMDGTWKYAREMVKANLPLVGDGVIQVSLSHDISREGLGIGNSEFIIRKEPFFGCVSTMEAVARALAILEPNGADIEAALLSVLRYAVQLQQSWIERKIELNESV